MTGWNLEELAWNLAITRGLSPLALSNIMMMHSHLTRPKSEKLRKN